MITRDEPKMLYGALNACLPYLSEGTEFILIDGSKTASAMPVLQKFTNKTKAFINYILKPQDWEKRKWENEADYRNNCWDLCKYDYILSLDDDEAFDKIVYEKLGEAVANKQMAIYFPTINFYGSTKKIINPEMFPDLHIRFANKRLFKWVGGIHSSLWFNGVTPIMPIDPLAKTMEHPLYHYARIDKNTKREYGDIPTDTIDYLSEHPRKEFD